MRILFLSAIAIFLSACVDPCVDEFIRQAADKEQKTAAVHIRRNCGATTGDAEQVYIVVSGTSYKDAEPIFTADKADNLAINWLDGRTLEISYDSARIFNFKNFWHSVEVDNFQYVIKVALREGSQ